jgi:Protein of unknown function (DUF4241)
MPNHEGRSSVPMPAPDFARIFTEGEVFLDASDLPQTVSVADIGVLGLSTGRLYAGDPLTSLKAHLVEPFTVTVAPGTYRVRVAVLRPHRPVSGRIAAAKLVIADVPVESWELAVRPGQDVSELAADQAFGYVVDAGVGCFVDAASAPVFEALQAEDRCSGPVFAVAERGSSAADVRQGGDGHTIAVFKSGWGDGCYPTWIGRAADGSLACFATEFFVVPEDDRVAGG